MIAIIGGTSLLESKLFSDLEKRLVKTEFGTAWTLWSENLLFIQRHGENADTPPHNINYRANIAAVRQLGFSRIIAVNSTGSLNPEIPPGSLLIPHDYFNLFNVPTFFDHELKFTVPGLDPGLRGTILNTAHSNEIRVIPEGVYFQVRGPILETPTEINFAKQIGDVIGMTMAHEAILAKELDLSYASICMVDNYANGIAKTQLSLEEIDKRRSENLETLEKFLGLIKKQIRLESLE